MQTTERETGVAPTGKQEARKQVVRLRKTIRCSAGDGYKRRGGTAVPPALQVIQVCDNADVYNLVRRLCSGHAIVCTYKDGKTECTCDGLTLRKVIRQEMEE